MTDPFADPRLMLRRAHHHIADFNWRVIAYMHSKPWSHVIEDDADGIHKIHKIRFDAPPPEFALVLFDALNNLRAALDQTAYATAVLAKNTRLKAVKFPFAADAAHINNVIKGSCKDLPPVIQALFRGFNPYKGGNDTLWALNELCNTSKHLKLAPTQISSHLLTWSRHVDPGIEMGVGEPSEPSWDSEKNEVTFDRVPAGITIYLQHDNAIAFGISVEGIKVVQRITAITLLDDMASIVESVILATEAECRRVGLLP